MLFDTELRNIFFVTNFGSIDQNAKSLFHLMRKHVPSPDYGSSKETLLYANKSLKIQIRYWKQFCIWSVVEAKPVYVGADSQPSSTRVIVNLSN